MREILVIGWKGGWGLGFGKFVFWADGSGTGGWVGRWDEIKVEALVAVEGE